MNSKDVIDFFGSTKATAEALGITSQAVSQWGDEVPGSRVKNAQLAMDAERVNRKIDEKRKAKSAK